MRHGHLYYHFQTGSEGVVWMVDDDSAPPGEQFHLLGTGDHLIVRNEQGAVLFDGVVHLDYDLNKEPAGFRQDWQIQRIDGTWVAGVPVGVDPKAWLRWFIDSLPCEFLPAPKTS